MKQIIKGSILAIFFAGFFSCSGGRSSCESYGNARYEKYKTMHVKKKNKDAEFSYKKKRYNLEFQDNGG